MKPFCFIPGTTTYPPAILRDCRMVSDIPDHMFGIVVWCPIVSYCNVKTYTMLISPRTEYDTLEEAIADNISEVL